MALSSPGPAPGSFYIGPGECKCCRSSGGRQVQEKKKKACSCAKPPPDMTCPDQSCCPTGKRISFQSRGPSSVPELTEELQGLEREWSLAVLVESRSARRRWLWLPQKEAWRSVHLAKVGAGQRVGFSEPIPDSFFSMFLPVASTQVR